MPPRDSVASRATGKGSIASHTHATTTRFHSSFLELELDLDCWRRDRRSEGISGIPAGKGTPGLVGGSRSGRRRDATLLRSGPPEGVGGASHVDLPGVSASPPTKGNRGIETLAPP